MAFKIKNGFVRMNFKIFIIYRPSVLLEHTYQD